MGLAFMVDAAGSHQITLKKNTRNCTGTVVQVEPTAVPRASNRIMITAIEKTKFIK